MWIGDPNGAVLPFGGESGTAASTGEDLISTSLAKPIGSPRLADLAKGRSNAVILISDISRLCPSSRFLEPLLDEINAGGIPDKSITVLVALGVHRKQTDDELRQLAGEKAFKRVRVLNHSALSEDCVQLGITSRGTPVEINRHAAEADLLIATGNIEPHRLVGLSGGPKALFPGVASYRSIEANHGLSQQFTAVPGYIDNPIHADLIEVLNYVPIHYLFNVVVNARRDILGVFSGDLHEAHQAGADFARRVFLHSHEEPCDVVIASAGGEPKDLQLYQAIKTLQNAASCTKPDGSILLLAECKEHWGNGLFQFWAETFPDRDAVLRQLDQRFVLGPHKIRHLDKVLKNHTVYLYSAMPSEAVLLCGMHPVHDLQKTIDKLTKVTDCRVGLMPCGSLTFPAKKRDPEGLFINQMSHEGLEPSTP